MDPQRVPVIGAGPQAGTESAGGTATGTGAATGSTGPAGPTPRPPFRRRTGDAILGGVASGLARTLDLDPALVRIAFVVLMLALDGLGIVAYLAAWALVPPDDEPTAAAARRGAGIWIGAGLIALGGFMVLERLGDTWGWGAWRPWRWFAADLLLPLAIVAAGALVWWRAGVPDASAPMDAPAAPDTTLPGGTTGGGSRLAPLVLGMALMVLGGLWTADGLDVTSLGATRIASATLLVIALGLLVGSVVGRARGLILPGAILALVVVGMLGAARADDTLPGTAGVTTLERPDGVADLPPGGYQWGAGDVVLDLRRLGAAELAAAGAPVVVSAELGVGTLEVIVPRGVGLDVTTTVGIGTLSVDPDADLAAEVGIGRLDAPGTAQRGLGLRREADTSAADADPTLGLRLEVGVGRIIVTEG